MFRRFQNTDFRLVRLNLKLSYLSATFEQLSLNFENFRWKASTSRPQTESSLSSKPNLNEQLFVVILSLEQLFWEDIDPSNHFKSIDKLEHVFEPDLGGTFIRRK